MQKLDPDVQSLYDWAMTVGLTPAQYAILSIIVQRTVQHKLQAFADEFIEMDISEFRKEQSDQIEEKKNKTGLWSES